MKDLSLFVMKPFSFSTLFAGKNWKGKKKYHLLIKPSPEELVVANLYEESDEKKVDITFENSSFGIFDSFVAQKISQEFIRKKTSFDFVKGLSCSIGLKKITAYNARVYKFTITDHQLHKKVRGRLYQRNNDHIIVFDKPNFGLLNSCVETALIQEILDSKKNGSL